MTGLLIGLGLASAIRADGPVASGGAPAPGRATLLTTPVHLGPPDDSTEASMPAPAPLDPAVLRVQSNGDARNADQPGVAAGEDALPTASPLPVMAQAGGPAGAQGGGQPGAAGRAQQPGPATVPSPPAPRPPGATQPRTTPAQTPQGANRPQADVSQQVQFDPSGLVTMHTNELDVRQLLELLSRRSGMNILVSPKVTGTITANFEGITVEKVLDAIIKLAGLVDRKEGSIHYIYTKEEVQDDAEFTKKERILTKVYKLNYVRADEILGVIRPFLSRDVGQKRISVTPSYRFGISESATFVSGGGQAMSASVGGGGAAAGTGGPGGAPPTGGGPTIGGFQPPTGGNSLADFDHLIIQDYESNLQIIDQIIQRIDVRPVQVLIEAVIISVDYEHERTLGVNLGLVDNLGQALGTIGSGTSLNGNVGFTPYRVLTTTGQIASGAVADSQGFTSGSTTGIKFGFVSNNVTGFIQALETIGSTKILASPRILVLNKQRAEIQLGTRLGFQTLSQNFTSTIQQVQFLNTGTLLRLRPFVSDDGMVRMEIHPERSSGTVTNNIPNQNTAELTTNVMVQDGSTLVIGGLIEDEDDYNYQGLPILSRFPALGFLTGINQKIEGRRELVVLLTPHIWSGEAAMTHAPPPAHGIPGAFVASGPGANGATTFDLETGRTAGNDRQSTGPPLAVGSGVTPSPSSANGPATDPGASSTGVGDPAHPTMPAAGAPVAADCPPASPVANTSPSDPATQKSRRRSVLREWLTRKSRDKQPAPSTNLDGRAQPSRQAPDPGAMPQPVATALRPDAGTVGPQPLVAPTTPADPEARPPAPSEPQPPPSGNEAPSPGIEPLLPVPVGVTETRSLVRRDTMVARAGWNPDRPDEIVVTYPKVAAPSRVQSSAAPRPPRPRNVVAGPRRHTVAAGEDLASIARLYYGSDEYAEPLREYNRGRIARGGLRPGDLLVIPAREDLPTSGGWVVQAPAGAPLDRHRADPDRSPMPRRVRQPDTEGELDPRRAAIGAQGDRSLTDGYRPSRQARAIYHVVGPDESPRSIARDRLGDASRAGEIINLNHDLLASEGRWKPGLRILLPPDAR